MCTAEGLGIMKERGKYMADPYGYGKEGGPVTRDEIETGLALKWEEEFPGEPDLKACLKKKRLLL